MNARTAAALLMLGGAVMAHAAKDRKAQCEATKTVAAAKKVYSKAKCNRKALLKQATADPACIAKAERKFADAIVRADRLGTCPGTAMALEASADAYLTALLTAVGSAAPCQTIVGGFCWFLGASGDSCDTTCVAQNRTYDAATETYAGSSGTNGNCQAVLNALGVAGTPLGAFCAAGGLGCSVFAPATLAWCSTPTTTATASFSGWERACACD